VVSLAIAIPFAVWAAYRSGGWVDKVINTTAFGLISLPSFAIALILTYYLGVKMGWLPTQGYVRLSEDPAEHFRSVAIPVMRSRLGQIAVYMRLLRSDLVATLQEDFILMAKLQGHLQRPGAVAPRPAPVEPHPAHRGRAQHGHAHRRRPRGRVPAVDPRTRRAARRGGAQPAVRGPAEPGGDHRHRLRPHQLRSSTTLYTVLDPRIRERSA
jgi:hypothetical protein